jgi:hypothetical protein
MLCCISIQWSSASQRQTICGFPYRERWAAIYLLLLKKEQLAFRIVIRHRLTAQGNGQAVLDHQGTRRPATPGDLVPPGAPPDPAAREDRAAGSR